MKKFAIEVKWGIIFSVVMLIWMVMEKMLGWHDEHIDKHTIYTNFFALPAIVVFVFALLDKRKNFYRGRMSWLDGFLAGFGISIVITILSPFTQFITNTFITPDYFQNVIAYLVKIGKMTQEEAEAYFNLSNYMMQSALGGLLMGVITSAIVAFFVKKK